MRTGKAKVFAVLMAAAILLTMMPAMTQSAFAKSKAKPAKVTGVTIAEQTADSVKIQWKKVKSAKKYQVRYASKDKNGTVQTKKTAVTIRVKTENGCTFKVRAYNGKYGKWSATVTIAENTQLKEAREKVKAARTEYQTALQAYENKDATDFLNQNAELKSTDWDQALANTGGELGAAYQAKKDEIKNYFTVKSLSKAADLIAECNDLRANDTVRVGGSKAPLTIDYNLMIGAAYAGMISEQTMYHTLFIAAPGADGSYGENLAWRYRDPFDGWYYGELPAYQEYLQKGYSSDEYGHYTNMTDDFTTTGLGWNSTNATACQRFGYSRGVTPEAFKSALEQFASAEKTRVEQAETVLNEAQTELEKLTK